MPGSSSGRERARSRSISRVVEEVFIVCRRSAWLLADGRCVFAGRRAQAGRPAFVLGAFRVVLRRGRARKAKRFGLSGKRCPSVFGLSAGAFSRWVFCRPGFFAPGRLFSCAPPRLDWRDVFRFRLAVGCVRARLFPGVPVRDLSLSASVGLSLRRHVEPVTSACSSLDRGAWTSLA